MKSNRPNQNISDLIDNAFCIGCGACSVASPKISLNMNSNGFYRPLINSPLTIQENEKAITICPFSDNSWNEDQLAEELMSELPHHAPVAGKYLSSSIISLNDESIRLQSTSAGFTTWILEKLMQSQEIDGVIHVSEYTNNGVSSPCYSFSISNTISDIRAKSKTRYYPVEMSHVLKRISNDNLIYAIVGLPCFIRAIQNMRRTDVFWRNKIKFTISLFCGHLKSAHFTSHILNSAGVKRNKVSDLDYRAKSPNWVASNYISAVSTRTNTNYIDLNKIPAGSWATGAFKYFACNFCDDIIGETADISIGDAWMLPYKNDWKGHNNIIARNTFIQELISKGSKEGELNVIEESIDFCTYGAAKGGITDRRDGLAYRLSIMDSQNLHRPRKRILPSNQFSNNRKELIAIKMFAGIVTSNLYTFAKAKENTMLFLIPVYLLEFWYKAVRRLRLPFLIVDIVLKFTLKHGWLKR